MMMGWIVAWLCTFLVMMISMIPNDILVWLVLKWIVLWKKFHIEWVMIFLIYLLLDRIGGCQVTKKWTVFSIRQKSERLLESFHFCKICYYAKDLICIENEVLITRIVVIFLWFLCWWKVGNVTQSTYW